MTDATNNTAPDLDAIYALAMGGKCTPRDTFDLIDRCRALATELEDLKIRQDILETRLREAEEGEDEAQNDRQGAWQDRDSAQAESTRLYLANRPMRKALLLAAERFREYQAHHAMKPDLEKAERDGKIAEMCVAAISGKDPTISGKDPT